MLISNIQEKCRNLFAMSNLEELSKYIEKITKELSFDFFAATVVIDHSAHLTQFQNLTNAPRQYLDCFLDLEAGMLDPVSQHCKSSGAPLIWTQATYTNARVGFLWEYQAEFGYRSGMQCAIHLPRGRHFMFGVDCNRSTICPEEDSKYYLEDFLILLPYLQAAVFEFSDISSRFSSDSAKLTTRECDLLRWSLDGHSVSELAERALISPSMVELRFHHIMQKLKCSTRYEAILRAMKTGAISVD